MENRIDKMAEEFEVKESQIRFIELQIRGKSEIEFLSELVKKGVIKSWSKINQNGNYKISF